ncbi:hypothetical protein RB195_019560 [Necator americanus]|uniref:Uncharacterized protein n=1 Tax=Necator americanus TaxID=51031 RepID=A0ABR1CHB7_NECAM
MNTSSEVYLRRTMNMEKDLKEELNRRMKAARAAFEPVGEATDLLMVQRLCDHLFDSTVSQSLSYAAETRAGYVMSRIDDKQGEGTLEWIQRDAKPPRERQPTMWGDVFAARMDKTKKRFKDAAPPVKTGHLSI